MAGRRGKRNLRGVLFLQKDLSASRTWILFPLWPAFK